MCGRYTLKTSGVDLQRELNLELAPTHDARYNIAPTQATLIVTQAHPRKATLARWGLLPSWTKDTRIASKLINARSETLTEKPAFKDLIAQRRCVVPCDGFYEWKREGQQRTPMYIELPTHQLLTMAGLWTTWRSPDGVDVDTFTVITTEANAQMKPIHDRMPVFLDGPARAQWLAASGDDTSTLLKLLVPWRGPPLSAYQVSAHVNSVAADDPACIAPAKTVQLSLL